MNSDYNSVLAFDPGGRNCGYANIVYDPHSKEFYFEDIGDIELTCDEFGGRIYELTRRIYDQIDRYPCDFICYENVLFGRNVTNAFNTAKIIGGIELVAWDQTVACVGYPPQKIKKLITGNGRATKDEMRQAIGKLIDAEKSDEYEDWYTKASHHIIDACAIGIVGIQQFDPEKDG